MVAVKLTAGILTVNVTLKQGADATISLTTVDANGNVITNPAGYSIRGQIRATPSGLVLFEWNGAPAGLAQGPATLSYSAGPPPVSTTSLVLTGAQTALFTFGSAMFDCFMTSPTNQVACLAEGTINMEPYITH